MMDLMRKAAPAIIIVVVLVFGGASLAGYGANSVAMKEANKAIGTVGGEKITRMDFDKAYRNALSSTRNNELSETEQQKLPMTVWDELVSQKIFEIIGEELSIDATSEEVLLSLLENPPAMLTQQPLFLDESGAFDKAKYNDFITTEESFNHAVIKDLVKYLNSMLPYQKLVALVEAGNFISPAVAEEQYHLENDKVSFEYLMVRPYSMKVDDKVTDAEIEKYYNANKDEFESKEQAELYYIKVEKKATKEDEVILRNSLKESKQRVLDGEEVFAAEVEIESEDENTIERGGALGWMQKGDFPAFDPVFELKAGEMSEPIMSRLGLHLVRVDSVDDTSDKGRRFVSHILKKIAPQVETLDSLDALGKSLLNKADSTDIFKAAEAFNFKVDSSGLFGKGDAVPGVGYFNEIGQFCFGDVNDSTSKNEHIENETSFYIVAVKQRHKAGVLSLENSKEQIKKILTDSLQVVEAEKYLTEQLAKATDSLAVFAEADSLLTAGVATDANRAKFVPGVGYNNSVIATAFLTDLNKMSGVVKEQNGVYAVRPTAREIAEAPTAEDITRITKELREKRKQALFTEWFVSYREHLGVEETIRNYYY